MRLRDKKLTTTALLAAAAIVLSIVESVVFGGGAFGIPGAKPGLANIAVILALVMFGGKTAFLIGLIKAAASFFASGAVTALWYALGGTVFSVAGMWTLYRFTRCFSLTGISAFGGFLSNLAQLGIMILITQTAEFLWYLPVLTVCGVISGSINGIVSNIVIQRIGI